MMEISTPAESVHGYYTEKAQMQKDQARLKLLARLRDELDELDDCRLKEIIDIH